MQLNYPIQVHEIILFICGRNINNNRICLSETMTLGKEGHGTSCPRRGGGLKARGKTVFGVLVLFFICNSSRLSVCCLLFSNG